MAHQKQDTTTSCSSFLIYFSTTWLSACSWYLAVSSWLQLHLFVLNIMINQHQQQDDQDDSCCFYYARSLPVVLQVVATTTKEIMANCIIIKPFEGTGEVV